MSSSYCETLFFSIRIKLHKFCFKSFAHFYTHDSSCITQRLSMRGTREYKLWHLSKCMYNWTRDWNAKSGDIYKPLLLYISTYQNNAMVTYSLRRVCGDRTATLIPQTVQRPYGFYANRTATLRFLARRKVIASLAVCLTWHWTFFRNRNAATPQPYRKCIVRSPYGDRMMTYGLTLSWVPRKSYGGLAAAVRRPYGDRTVNLW